MLFREMQPGYPPSFDAVGCACLFADRVLLLKRREDKPFPSHWGMPTGKVEQGETRIEAIVRELREETGIRIPGEHLEYIREYYVIHDQTSFTYALYLRRFESAPPVKISPGEHIEYSWCPIDRVGDLELVADLQECLSDALRLSKF